jgi:response regulator of citrate/malate metabolism
MTDEQRLEVTRLQGLLEAYQREARAILELEQRSRQGSIDRILEKSDAELGLDALLRMLGKKPR